LPIISGHVGADAAACMLAIDIANEDRVVAVMDIGTNTELIIGNRHKVLAASCPAGPAFEGGQITFGMPGLPGAIEKVVINDDGKVATTVIGDIPAEGICGSGLVDLMSELLRTGRMNSLGRFEESGCDFVVAGENSERPITFSEADVNASTMPPSASSTSPVVSGATSTSTRRSASDSSPTSIRKKFCRSATPRSKARASHCSRAPSGRSWNRS
jgi:uncharacterized 2Fe-2S/4Fe-4S cluster protein (DUF4445 family)